MSPSAPPRTPAPLVTPTPALGLTWAIVRDVERPAEAFDLPSDLPTGPAGPGTAGHPGHFPGQAILHDVAASGDRLVAVGFSATGDGVWTARAWASTDGVHWALATIDPRPASFAVGIAVAGDGRFVAVGRSGSEPAAWTSADGRAWERAAVSRLHSGAREREPERMTAVLATPDGLIAGGSAGPELGDRQARFWRSRDGRSWDAVPDDAAFRGAEAIAIAPWAGGFVALGGIGTGMRFTGSLAWRSPDGVRWQRVDDAALAGGLAVSVVGDDHGLLAVGSDLDEREAVAWSSKDGTTWVRAPSERSRLHSGEKIRMTDVVTVAGGFVAVGNYVGVQFGTATSWTSPDGATWMQAPDQPVLGQGEPESVIAWRDRLVIVGSVGAPDNYIPTAWISPGLP